MILGFPFGTLSNQWINQQSIIPSGVDQYKQQLLFKIDTELRLQAAEWSEHKTPDGKIYFFNSKTQQSVWEKPKVLIQLEGILLITYFSFCFNLLNLFFLLEALEEAKKKESEQSAKLNNKENFNNKSEVRLQESEISENLNKKEDPKDKSKPVSSTPITGTPWYSFIIKVCESYLILVFFCCKVCGMDW